VFGPPKTDAGKRTVVIPSLILPDIRDHLSSQVKPDPNALVFVSPTSPLLRHSNFRKRVWLPTQAAAGLTCVHFHDLRHAGNLLIAHAEANLREPMDRLGQSRSRPALIYLHSTSDRQRTLADAVSDRAREELGETNPCGTRKAAPPWSPSIEVRLAPANCASSRTDRKMFCCRLLRWFCTS
jgi:integrase